MLWKDWNIYLNIGYFKDQSKILQLSEAVLYNDMRLFFLRAS